MNNRIASNFQKLAEIASKESKLVLGLMSGTSMDGLDVALCRLKGQGVHTIFELLEFHTSPHTADYQEKIATVFTRRDADAVALACLHQYVAEVHAGQVLEALGKWKMSFDQIDLIASHGQTVFHDPAAHPFPLVSPGPVTIQLGDGDFIARHTGIITISDFRQKNIASGGEGAPLALYGDLLLFSDTAESRILVNIGGIANFTWLPVGGSGESPVCSDTGPGNTMMDAYMKKNYGLPYDKDSAVGKSGHINQKLLKALMDDPFFKLPLPKTTGPELFNPDYLGRKMATCGEIYLSHGDIMATLHEFTAQSITTAVRSYLSKSTPVFVSGGGLHNPLLMENLNNHMQGHTIKSTSELGIDPDAKEAIIFALLANECMFGIPDTYPEMGHRYPKTTMGKVSFPG